MQRMTLRATLVACVVMMLMALSMASVAAQTATSAPVTGGATFTGKITKTSPLTVNSNGQDRQINAGTGTTVLRDGKAATLGDLKTGDQVNVTSNPDNTVSRIETTGAVKSSAGFLKWLIPLLIVLFILGLLFAFLSRRKAKDDFVLERDATNTPNSPRR